MLVAPDFIRHIAGSIARSLRVNGVDASNSGPLKKLRYMTIARALK